MVSFQPTEDEQVLCDAVRRFAIEQVRPALRSCDEQGDLPDRLARSFWQLGLALMHQPAHLGGSGLGAGPAALVEEELAWGDPGVSAGLPRPGLAGSVIDALDEATQRRWLEPFTREMPAYGAAALSDPWPGQAATISARLEGEEIILDGWVEDVANPDRAEWILVGVGLEAAPLLLAVSANVPGISFAPDPGRLGLRAARYGRLTFHNSPVIRGDVLCEGQLAATALRRALERDVLAWAARATGTARAALEYAVRYSLERHAFGRPIAEHQAVGFMLADMAILVDAARALLWQAAWAVDTAADRAEDLTPSAALFARDAVVRVTTDSVQVLGGHGYVQDHPVEKWMRDARCIANMIDRVLRLRNLFVGRPA